MRRSAMACLALFLAGTLVGCEEPQKNNDMQEYSAQSASMEPDYYAADPAGSVANEQPAYTDSYSGGYSDSYADSGSAGGNDAGGYEVVYSASSPYPQSEPTYTASANQGGRTHMVAKGETLFSLARMYYNDAGRWRDIMNANAGAIRNPDLIYVGQELVIP